MYLASSWYFPGARQGTTICPSAAVGPSEQTNLADGASGTASFRGEQAESCKFASVFNSCDSILSENLQMSKQKLSRIFQIVFEVNAHNNLHKTIFLRKFSIEIVEGV